ncbi:hypothetical protein FF38_14358 [Lucilia cuprina]|uniref:Salivary secreted peptide n=1 Tax=Lucilia cuprina TaxID=7375 RepID=A0A0L0CFZ5_LUCCU|nr:hypothetical protein CVS40_4395 [Lucilia cuprina]KNC31170.1 hypothetical protein FF38_14358 [Lucilia cuprina]
MSPIIKMLFIILSICCLIQAIEMARLRRDEKSVTNAKKPSDGDVKALGEILIKKLEDSLKDCDQTIKNILSCAKTSLQQTQPVAVAG